MKQILITTFVKQILIISIMNENLNLVEILKDCPRATKLYSTVFGEVEFEEVRNNTISPIDVCIDGISVDGFTADGRLYEEFDGECVLFPSKDQRDWSKFKVKKERFNPETLKPFDKVLVRDDIEAEWMCDLFSHMRPEMKYNTYCCAGTESEYCIPYNDDTKHLVGTPDEAPEFYRYWED